MFKNHVFHDKSSGVFERVGDHQEEDGLDTPQSKEHTGSAIPPDDESQSSPLAFSLERNPRCKVPVNPIVGVILLYMVVSMALTLLDKFLVTGWGFGAPLTLISLTYLIMHLVSLSVRAHLRRRQFRCRQRGLSEGSEGDASPLLLQLSMSQWAWKVFPIAAASGLEVGTSTLGLRVMMVGVHTMVRSTVPIFVLLFSVGMGLQEFRCALLAVVLLVSGGVAMLVSGQKSDANGNDFPVDGFLLTLLSGMLAGIKWTLSQVLLQGRGFYGRNPLTSGECIHPFTLLHYMSLSSAIALAPFVLALELGALREMAGTFSGERVVETALLVVGVSLLALVLVLTEFSFIKNVSSLSLCIIGVVKELLLVLFSVGVLGERLSGRTGVGFFVTMLGVTLYKLIPKESPKGRYEAAAKHEGQQRRRRLGGGGAPASSPSSSSPLGQPNNHAADAGVDRDGGGDGGGVASEGGNRVLGDGHSQGRSQNQCGGV